MGCAGIGGNPVRTTCAPLWRRPARGSHFALPQPGCWDPAGSVVFAADEGGVEHIRRHSRSQVTWQPTGAPVRITAGVGESQPAVAGDLIAFAGVERKTNIWALPVRANEGRADGPLEQLTSDSSSDYNPAISRDGRLLIYESQRSLSSSDLWSKDLVTGKSTQLTATPWFEYNPAISGDSSLVAYTVFEQPPKVTEKEWFGALTLPGGVFRKICEQDCFLSWGLNSDGSELLYSADVRHHKLALLNTKTGAKQPLVEHPTDELFQASFSPDRSLGGVRSAHSFRPDTDFRGSIRRPEPGASGSVDSHYRRRYAGWQAALVPRWQPALFHLGPRWSLLSVGSAAGSANEEAARRGVRRLSSAWDSEFDE